MSAAGCRVLFGSAVLLLVGCVTVGPDFEEPEVAWLAQWQMDLYGWTQATGEGASSGVDTGRLDLRFWWQVFNDPVLDALITAAREDNLTLRLAGLRILESRATLGIVRSTRYPQVQQVTGAVGYVNSQQTGGDAPDSSDDFAAYDAGFNLGWELDFWGRFRRGIESADAAFFASMANHQDVQVLLAAEVADLYFALTTTRLRLEITRHNADIQRRSLEITEELFEQGEESELDVQQAKTQYLSTISAIPELEITETRVRNALAALLGRPPQQIDELSQARYTLPTVRPDAIGDVPAALLARRPDVRAAAWLVAAQSAQIGVAKADYFPAIALVGSLGWSSDSLGATPDITTFGVGPALTWNVLDWGRIGNNVRVQDARLQQAVVNYQDRVLGAARELDDAAIELVKTGERQQILTEAAQSARRALDLASIRYQEGYSDFQRVLDAQRALFSAQERELVNQGSHVSALVAFYKALGGGWLEADIDRLVPEAVRDKMRSRTKWGDLLDAPLPENGQGPRALDGATTP
ncbi:MAG: efflux transporter outer membrane subunit [Pseudomonadales bacterium]